MRDYSIRLDFAKMLQTPEIFFDLLTEKITNQIPILWNMLNWLLSIIDHQ